MDEKVVYIIVAAIWIITSIIKAVNKGAKKNAPQTTSPPRKTSSSGNEMEEFKKILEDMITGNKSQTPDPIPVKNVENIEDEKYTSLQRQLDKKYESFQGQTNHRFDSFVTLEDSFQSKNMDNQVDENEPEKKDAYTSQTFEHEDDLEFYKHINLKHAIVYSEILKRPDY